MNGSLVRISDPTVIAVMADQDSHKPKEVELALGEVEINAALLDRESNAYYRLCLSMSVPLGQPDNDCTYLSSERFWRYRDGLAYPLADGTHPFGPVLENQGVAHKADRPVRFVIRGGISKTDHDVPIQKLPR